MDETTYFLQEHDPEYYKQQQCQSNWLHSQVFDQKRSGLEVSNSKAIRLSQANQTSRSRHGNMTSDDASSRQPLYPFELEEHDNNLDDLFEQSSYGDFEKLSG